MEDTFVHEKFEYCNVLSVPLILNQIFQFLDKDNIKCLSLCHKKLFQIIKLKFYNYMKKLKYQILKY